MAEILNNTDDVIAYQWLVDKLKELIDDYADIDTKNHAFPFSFSYQGMVETVEGIKGLQAENAALRDQLARAQEVVAPLAALVDSIDPDDDPRRAVVFRLTNDGKDNRVIRVGDAQAAAAWLAQDGWE